LKKIYRIKRKKNYIFEKKKKINVNFIEKKKKASMLKNIMYNKKEILFFSLTGIIKIKKENNVNKSFTFVGNTSRTSIKYSFDFFYPGIELF
jgi:hypothetical protein